MENNENNNLNELEQLKAQYETLKQQFDQQEIVNERLMKSSIKRNVGFFTRYRRRQFILYPLAILAGLLITKWEFSNNLSLRLFLIAYLVVSFAIEIGMLRKLNVKKLEKNDLLTLSNQARSFKVFYTLLTILSAVPMLILSVGLFAHTGYDHLPNFGRILTILCITMVLFVSVGIAEIRHKTKLCDEIIQQIEASEGTENTKTGFNRKQKWFCAVMFVAFLCLDVWAYTIVASHLKLPPMWQTKEYVRAADDLSTEGKLEFWEVFTDTVVPEGNVSAVMKQWQQNDSLVVMVANEKPTTLGLDETSIHERKEEEKPQAKVYMLKKTTPEGPPISSAIMEGKPLVQKVVVNHPRKYPSRECVPIIVTMTPEAAQLWYQFTTELTGHQAALSLDGIVFQEWKIMQGLDNGCFFIMKKWSSKEELEAFCQQLIRQ